MNVEILFKWLHDKITHAIRKVWIHSGYWGTRVSGYALETRPKRMMNYMYHWRYVRFHFHGKGQETNRDFMYDKKVRLDLL